MSYYLTKAPYWITRFGEIGIVLPIAIALTLWLLLSTHSLRPVLGWLLALGTAVALTTLSKIAFIGWGIGIPALDFTGFSGHAMFAASIYPVLAYTLASQWTPSRTGTVLVTLGGYALALLIAWSRVHIQVHSVSEVVAGFALGTAASGWSIWYIGRVPARPRFVRLRWALIALAGWLTVMPLHAAPSRSHDIVTRIALELADRAQPFRRVDLHGYVLPQT